LVDQSVSRRWVCASHIDPTASVVWAAALSAAIAIYLQGRSPVEVVFSDLFLLVLAGVSIVDLRERRIPNLYTSSGLVVALLVATSRGTDVALMSLLGVAMAGGVMAVAHLASGGRLGVGDVKLSAFIGAVLGVSAVPSFLLLSSVLGCGAGFYVFVRTRNRKAMFAYGPCLAIAAAAFLILNGTVGG
jgi:leader peptidase (prepilin peptidase) / N-methyltransferase